jgi:hypothetical protein
VKRCSKCGSEKPLDQFHREARSADGKRPDCKDCSLARRKVYYRANRSEERRRHVEWKSRNPDYFKVWALENADSIKTKAKRYHQNNLPRYRENTRRWRAENLEKARELGRTGYARRSRVVTYRINHTVSACVYRSIKQAKGGRPTFEILGYSLEDLMAHLQRQFLPKMSWRNFGSWHIDHIIPLSSFAYKTPADPAFRSAWALTNLRPMWATDNLKKGAKRLTLL